MRKNRSKPENEIFSMQLNDAILESGLTREKLHKECDLSVGIISDYTAGAKAPNYLAFRRLAKALGVSYEYLYGEVEAKKTKNREISMQLGLSDKAIQTIKKMREKNTQTWTLNILNYLLEHDDFAFLMAVIADYVNVDKDKTIDSSTDGQSHRASNLKYADVYALRLKDTFWTIIEGIEKRNKSIGKFDNRSYYAIVHGLHNDGRMDEDTFEMEIEKINRGDYSFFSTKKEASPNGKH